MIAQLLAKLKQFKTIFNFIQDRFSVTIPQILAYLGEGPSPKITSSQALIYARIEQLEKDKFIEKLPHPNPKPGGPQMILRATDLGINEFAHLDTKTEKASLDAHWIEGKLIEFSEDAYDVMQNVVQTLLEEIPAKETRDNASADIIIHKATKELGSYVKRILEEI